MPFVYVTLAEGTTSQDRRTQWSSPTDFGRLRFPNGIETSVKPPDTPGQFTRPPWDHKASASLGARRNGTSCQPRNLGSATIAAGHTRRMHSGTGARCVAVP
jgi:hypothetical protein